MDGKIKAGEYTYYPRVNLTTPDFINQKYKKYLHNSGISNCLMRDVRINVEDFRCVVGALGDAGCHISHDESIGILTSSIVTSIKEEEKEFKRQFSELGAFPGDVVTISGVIKEAHEKVLGGQFYFYLSAQSMKILEQEKFTIEDNGISGVN